MKPRKPFMVEVGNDYLRRTNSGRFKLVDWEGTHYATREDAAADCIAFGNGKVIEVLDETRAHIRAN